MPTLTASPLQRHTLGAAYPVTLPTFQGPLDLLLSLIEKEELDISEISLVTVTDQYLTTIRQMHEREPGALADFLVVASKLLYIKSRALLPKPRPPAEEDDEDTSDALLMQLLEYRRFKEVAAGLHAREVLGLHTYVRIAPRPALERPLDLSNVDVTKLHAVLRRVLQRISVGPPMPRVKSYPITVAEQIERVRMRIRQSSGVRLPFVDLLGEQSTRLAVVVTFLAVLELIKQREVVAWQEETFGTILLTAPVAEDLEPLPALTF
jgi:segregation and condensation protein A